MMLQLESKGHLEAEVFPPSVEVTENSDQKILVLMLWQGRIQIEHIDIVREIRKFIIGKRGRDYRCGLCQVWSSE
jgi:hypothetical protein